MAPSETDADDILSIAGLPIVKTSHIPMVTLSTDAAITTANLFGANATPFR